MSDLTPKQVRFVGEYLIGLNATQAAVRAGYSEKSAKQQRSRLLTNADVQAAVAKGQAEKAEKLGLSQEWVLRRLVQVVERCLQAEAVGGSQGRAGDDRDARGRTGGGLHLPGGGAIRALELLGKHLNLFNETMKHQHDHKHEPEHHHVTAAEVQAEIEEWFSGPSVSRAH